MQLPQPSDPRSLSSPQNLTSNTAVSACLWSPSPPVPLLPAGTGTLPTFPRVLRRAGLALGCEKSFLLLTSVCSLLTSYFLPQRQSDIFLDDSALHTLLLVSQLLCSCGELPAVLPPPLSLSISLPPAQGPRQAAGRGLVCTGTLLD